MSCSHTVQTINFHALAGILIVIIHFSQPQSLQIVSKVCIRNYKLHTFCPVSYEDRAVSIREN